MQDCVGTGPEKRGHKPVVQKPHGASRAARCRKMPLENVRQSCHAKEQGPGRSRPCGLRGAACRLPRPARFSAAPQCAPGTPRAGKKPGRNARPAAGKTLHRRTLTYPQTVVKEIYHERKPSSPTFRVRPHIARCPGGRGFPAAVGAQGLARRSLRDTG